MAPPKPIQGIWNVPSIPEPTKGRALHLLRNKKPTDSPRPAKANHGASERPTGEKIGRSIDARASPLRYTLAVERGHMNTHEHNSHFALAARHALSDPHALTPLVLLMGFLGASLRYALEVALPAQGGFPAATLIVNIFGCFTLEIINQYVGRRTQLPAPLVKSMGIGLVGAFTTISAFSTECLAFLQAGRYEIFAAYMAATIATTFIAALAGHRASRALEARRARKTEVGAAR